MGENKGYIKNSDEKGSINISEDVIAVIAASAASEIEGVHGLFFPHGKDLTDMLGKKGLSRGVKLLIDGENVTIDIYILVDIGHSVSDVGAQVQKAVMSAVEAAVGIAIESVNVHICGISLKKNKPNV